MTTPAELEVKINRLPDDLDLLHDFVKGDDTTDVVGVDGTYPSLAKFLANLEILASANQIVFCDVVRTSTRWEMTPRAGYTIVADGAEQILVGRAPNPHGGSQLTLDVAAITAGDARTVVASNMTTILTTDAISEGAFFAVRFRPGTEPIQTGKFEAILPVSSATASAPVGPFVWMTMTARTNNFVTLEKVGGSLPNNTGGGYIMAWLVPTSYTPASGEWRFAIDGITLDPLIVHRRDGTEVTGSDIVAGDMVFFTRPSAAYVVLEIWNAASAAGGGSSGEASTDSLLIANGAAQRAAEAGRKAKRVAQLVEGEWEPYTPTVSATTPGAGMTFVIREGRFKKIGKTVHVVANVDVNALGSNSGYLTISLPDGLPTKVSVIGNAWERQRLGRQMVAQADAGTTTMVIYLSNAISAWLTGAPHVQVNITYETSA